MKTIKINDKPILFITDTMKKVICNDIKENEYDADIERRLVWSIMGKYQACFDRLKAEWDPKLAKKGIEMIPTDQSKYAELVFSQPEYQNRTEREK